VLMRAAESGRAEVVDLLVSSKADISVLDSSGSSALNLAISGKNKDCERVLKQGRTLVFRKR